MLKGVLCRSILHPKCVHDGQFDPLAFLLLNRFGPTNTDYALSLASRFVLKDEDGAHSYGSRTAVRINEAYAIRHGNAPDQNSTTYYLGFYDGTKEEFLSIQSEHYDVSIRYRLEHGERAHFQLELTNRGILGTGKANDRIRRSDRATTMDQLLDKLVGPARDGGALNDDTPKEIRDFVLPKLPRHINQAA